MVTTASCKNWPIGIQRLKQLLTIGFVAAGLFQPPIVKAQGEFRTKNFADKNLLQAKSTQFSPGAWDFKNLLLF